MDEALGNVVSDSIGTSRGMKNGGAGWTADSVAGTAVSFRNAGDYISLGSPDTSFNQDQFSFSFWMKKPLTVPFAQLNLLEMSCFHLAELGVRNSSRIGSSNLEVHMNSLIKSGNVQLGLA